MTTDSWFGTVMLSMGIWWINIVVLMIPYTRLTCKRGQKLTKSFTLTPSSLYWARKLSYNSLQDKYFFWEILFQNSIVSGGKKSAPQEQVDEILARYDILETFLTLNPYVALDKLTIADFSLIATVTSIDLIVPVDAKKCPKITAWIKKAQALPYYSANKNGLDKLRGLIQAALEAKWKHIFYFYFISLYR